MDWRDLIAWQRVRETTLGGTSVQRPLRLCEQNPHRIYLSISLVDQQSVPYFISTITPNAAMTAGLPLGSQWTPPEYSLNGSIAVAERITALDSVPIQFAAPGDTGALLTAGIDIVTTAVGSDEIDAQLTTPAVIMPYDAPLRYEFHVDKHGVLAQLAWWTWDASSPSTWSVLEVIQDEVPCDRKPKVVQRGRFVRGLWLPVGCRSDGGGGDDEYADCIGERPPMGTHPLPDIPEPLLAILRRASGR